MNVLFTPPLVGETSFDLSNIQEKNFEKLFLLFDFFKLQIRDVSYLSLCNDHHFFFVDED